MAVLVAGLQNVMPTTRAAVALIAAALLALSAGALPVAADSPPISVLDSGYTIDFGSAIHFFLDAAATEAPITEIRVRFKPHGPDTVWSYDYARLSPGDTVHAEFDIPTSGAAYYPPGVRFEVYFVVTDAAGNTLRTQPVQVEYLDPRIEWEHRTIGALTAVSYDLPPSTVDALLIAAAERLPAIMETVGLEDRHEYRAILFSSTRNAESLFPPVSETTRREHTFAGFAHTEYGLFVLARPRAGLFIHELTHMLVADATRSPLGRPVPAWLNEGLAVYFETASSAVSRGSIQTAARRGELLPLSAMNTMPGRPDDISVFYPQSGAFVGYLIERFGRSSIAGVLQRLDSGTPIADAVEQAFGTPLAQLDSAFRAWMGAPPAPTPPPTPTSTGADTDHGTMVPSPMPGEGTPTAAPGAVPTLADTAPDQPPPDDDGTNILVYLLIVGVAGLVIGVVLGQWRRRRNREP